MGREVEIPGTLSEEAGRIWSEIVHDWILDASSLLVLKAALEAYDRLQAARAAIDAEGMTVVSPSGVVKPHPAIKIEEHARAGFLQAWRCIGFNLTPPGEKGV